MHGPFIDRWKEGGIIAGVENFNFYVVRDLDVDRDLENQRPRRQPEPTIFEQYLGSEGKPE